MASWITAAWSDCPKSCGSADQTRLVLCQEGNTSYKWEQEGFKLCKEPVPLSVKPCPVLSECEYHTMSSYPPPAPSPLSSSSSCRTKCLLTEITAVDGCCKQNSFSIFLVILVPVIFLLAVICLFHSLRKDGQVVTSSTLHKKGQVVTPSTAPPPPRKGGQVVENNEGEEDAKQR
jgi:hypothetical protein